MKQIFYLAIYILLFCSCEKEIGELTEYESPRLVVNALLTAQKEAQQLRIRMTGPMQVERVEGAEVTLSLNDSLIYSHTTSDEDALDLTTEGFKAGDIVKVDVRKAGMHASASAEVLPPVIITGVDTMTVMAKRYSLSDEMEPHRRMLVHLRQPEGTNTKETSFYRVEVYKTIYEVSSFSVKDDTLADVHYKVDADHTSFSYASDPALCESEGIDQENLSVSFDWLAGVMNTYYVFRSTYFEDGEYTLRLDFPSPYFLSEYGWAQYVKIRVYAISRVEYNYLMALSAYKNSDFDTVYDTEPGVTTNVMGGAGIFCVESEASVAIYDDHNLIKDGDRYVH